MRWASPDGVWRAAVYERDGELRFEIHRHDGPVRSGRLTILRAHEELDAVLADLGGPTLAEMVEM
ncbi:MAG: hypothetical protein QOI74_54 [Micromonosporaceae bacterium]|nr:hypothetical protein [Micromonosporaceae bacterium]MDT5038880.1 hypothetical protein [Micromonosporaceae bacterium]